MNTRGNIYTGNKENYDKNKIDRQKAIATYTAYDSIIFFQLETK